MSTVPVPELTPGRVRILACAAGLTVANNYYNQALLVRIADDLGVSHGATGMLSVLTQLGYAAGLMFISPLGDIVDRRKMLVATAVGAGLMMLAVACSPNLPFILIAGFFGGFVCVTPSLSVAHAASLAKPERRGRAVGAVLSGLLFGILLSRGFAGLVGESFGWRAAFATGSMVSLVAAFALSRLPATPIASVGTKYKELLLSLPAIVRREPELLRHSLIGGVAFASFGAFWTTLGFRLAEMPGHYDGRVVGAFGVVAAAGIAAASVSGRFTDLYGARKVSLVAQALLLLSFLIMGPGGDSLIVLGIAVFLMDAGVQATHAANYSKALSFSETERGRMNCLYMTTYFTLGAAGSALGTYAWGHFGWAGVRWTGVALSLLGLLLSLKKPKK